jgi:chaperonin GroEL
VREIRTLYADTNSTFRHQQLDERLRRLVGGAAVIRVGGTTDAETRERRARVEDALFATRAAIEEGIVPGGGVALLRAGAVLAKRDKKLSAEQAAAVAIVHRACAEPCRQIAENAGRDASVVVGRVLEGTGNYGYDAARDAFGDLSAAGVIDPTMVVRLALVNAASIAALLLTSEVVIADAHPDVVDYPESGDAKAGMNPEPFLSRRDRRPVGGTG